ncbi:MAG: cytochrome c family protein [Geminicoccaceae bacterium]|nr:cytochrome c family protein [Geminicoccaceae bacterium]
MSIAVLSISFGVAQAEGDAAKGEKVFRKCKACHDVEEQKNKVGPYLKGVIGRPSGTVEGFKYSDAMANADLTWDPETIDKYLADTKGFIPGNRMAFPGLKKEQDRADVIAYLQSMQ